MKTVLIVLMMALAGCSTLRAVEEPTDAYLSFEADNYMYPSWGDDSIEILTATTGWPLERYGDMYHNGKKVKLMTVKEWWLCVIMGVLYLLVMINSFSKPKQNQGGRA